VLVEESLVEEDGLHRIASSRVVQLEEEKRERLEGETGEEKLEEDKEVPWRR